MATSVFDVMATSVLTSVLPVGAPTRTCQRQVGPLSSSRVTVFQSNGTPLSSRFVLGRELGVGGKRASGLITQGRRGVEVKARENGEGGPQVDDEKPFYAALEFWIQVAVVILTFGFVDAGYSGDWSRIGALSRETEAQLRTAVYVVVPVSAALVWVIGKRKRIP